MRSDWRMFTQRLTRLGLKVSLFKSCSGLSFCSSKQAPFYIEHSSSIGLSEIGEKVASFISSLYLSLLLLLMDFSSSQQMRSTMASKSSQSSIFILSSFAVLKSFFLASLPESFSSAYRCWQQARLSLLTSKVLILLLPQMSKSEMVIDLLSSSQFLPLLLSVWLVRSSDLSLLGQMLEKIWLMLWTTMVLRIITSSCIFSSTSSSSPESSGDFSFLEVMSSESEESICFMSPVSVQFWSKGSSLLSLREDSTLEVSTGVNQEGFIALPNDDIQINYAVIIGQFSTIIPNQGWWRETPRKGGRRMELAVSEGWLHRYWARLW